MGNGGLLYWVTKQWGDGESMADKSPLAQSLVSPECEPPIPAPVGRTLLFISLALALSSGLCWCLRWNAAPPGMGIINGRSSPLLSDLTGRIERIWVNEGDTVRAGDPILVLVDEPLLLEIDRQKCILEEIQHALDRAEQSQDEQLAKQLEALDAEIIELKTQAGFLAPGALAPEHRLQELLSQRLDAAHQVRTNLGIDQIRAELLRAEAKLQELQSRPEHITLP